MGPAFTRPLELRVSPLGHPLRAHTNSVPRRCRTHLDSTQTRDHLPPPPDAAGLLPCRTLGTPSSSHRTTCCPGPKPAQTDGPDRSRHGRPGRWQLPDWTGAHPDRRWTSTWTHRASLSMGTHMPSPGRMGPRPSPSQGCVPAPDRPGTRPSPAAGTTLTTRRTAGPGSLPPDHRAYSTCKLMCKRRNGQTTRRTLCPNTLGRTWARHKRPPTSNLPRAQPKQLPARSQAI